MCSRGAVGCTFRVPASGAPETAESPGEIAEMRPQLCRKEHRGRAWLHPARAMAGKLRPEWQGLWLMPH